MCLLRGWLCARLSWGVLLLGESRFSSVPLLNEAYVPIVDGIQRPDRDTSAVLLAVPRGSLSDVRTANPYRWYCDVCERG